MDSDRRVQVAVVGLGAFGQRYIQALRGLSGVDILWGADREAALVEKASRKWGIPNVATDFRAACADPRVDLVAVVTPETAHREIAVTALEAGKHTLVEKPLATVDEDAGAMIEAAERSGKLLMTGFLLRFDYRYAQLQQRLPQIGTPRSLYAYRNFDRRLFETYSRTHSFIENAIHDIDLLLWLVQSPVVAASGYCRNTLGEPHPDVNWGVLEFENGAIAALQTTWLYPPQRHEDLQWNAGLQVMGDAGVLEVRNDGTGFVGNTESTGIGLWDQSGWAQIHGEPRGAFGAMLRHCLACVRGETVYRGAAPREAREAMRVACRLAEDAGRRALPRGAGAPPAPADPAQNRDAR